MITLPSPIVTQTSITSFEVRRIIDDPISKLVQVEFATNVSAGIMGIWSGDEYDKAGQYTDEDVSARVQELLSDSSS